MKNSKSSVLFIWPLYLSVAVLIINDHFLKQAYPSWFTGKLSDFAGIFLMYLIFREIFPKQVKTIAATIIVSFILWKSPYSQPIIDSINLFSPLKIGRIVDYADLVALSMLPFSHHIFENRTRYRIKYSLAKLLKIPVIMITALTILGTSVTSPYHKYLIRTEGNDQNIDRAKAFLFIKNAANNHMLSCLKCNQSEESGYFIGTRITLRYEFLVNNRGIEFEIIGKPDGLFSKRSFKNMNSIKHQLQNDFGSEFKNMEFVIKLPQRVYFNGSTPDTEKQQK